MVFDWNEEKNKQLKQERKIGFENVIIAIDEGNILDILNHHNVEKFGHQYLIVVDIDSYAYVVPAVLDGDCWFLKTIYPSRKLTKKYLKNEKEDYYGK